MNFFAYNFHCRLYLNKRKLLLQPILLRKPKPQQKKLLIV